MDEIARKDARVTAYNIARSWLEGVRYGLVDGVTFEDAVKAQRKRADSESKFFLDCANSDALCLAALSFTDPRPGPALSVGRSIRSRTHVEAGKLERVAPT